MYLIHPTTVCSPVGQRPFPKRGNEAGEVTEHVLLPKASLKLLDAAEDSALMGMSEKFITSRWSLTKGGMPDLFQDIFSVNLYNLLLYNHIAHDCCNEAIFFSKHGFFSQPRIEFG